MPIYRFECKNGHTKSRIFAAPECPPQIDCPLCIEPAFLVGPEIETGPLKGNVVVVAESEQVAQLEDEVQRVLGAIGHEEALVTDLSSIGDFDLEDDEIASAVASLGVPVAKADLIIEVAWRLKKAN